MGVGRGAKDPWLLRDRPTDGTVRAAKIICGVEIPCEALCGFWWALYAGYGEGLMGNVRNGIARLRVTICAGYGGARVAAVGSAYGCCCGESAKIFATFATRE